MCKAVLSAASAFFTPLGRSADKDITILNNFCHHYAKWEQQLNEGNEAGAEMEFSHREGKRNPLVAVGGEGKFLNAFICGLCLSPKAVYKLGPHVNRKTFVLMCRKLQLRSLNVSRLHYSV